MLSVTILRIRVCLALHSFWSTLSSSPTTHRPPPITHHPLSFSQAIEFTRQLSVYMAKHNRTKLPQLKHSTLFAFDARSSLDVFFSDDPLEKVVRATVPIRISGGFLTFIHKTIMEHSAAVAVVVDGIEAAVAASGLSPQQLIEVRKQCAGKFDSHYFLIVTNKNNYYKNN